MNRDDAGPRGFYDDPGDPERQTHVDMWSTCEENPSRIDRVTEVHYRWMNNETRKVDSRYCWSWLHHCQALHGAPLIMRYAGLDRNAEYRIKVVEFGQFGATSDLVADNKFPIHCPIRD